jgi:DNA-binding IclR family transcriptional regulator
MALSELAAELNIERVEAHQLGQTLFEKGFLSLVEQRADGEIVYRVRWGRTRARSVPLDL